MSGGFALLVLVVAIAIPVGIYLLADAEAEHTETMDRDAAERAARRDTGSADDRRDRYRR